MRSSRRNRSRGKRNTEDDMTLAKGTTKISITKVADARLKRVRRLMIAESPDKYDETTSVTKIIDWLIDKLDICP